MKDNIILVFLTVISCITFLKAEKVNSDCCDDDNVLSAETEDIICENNKSISLHCNGSIIPLPLSNSSNQFKHYSVKKDAEGSYLDLDAHKKGLKIPQPKYCIGRTDKPPETIAFYCQPEERNNENSGRDVPQAYQITVIIAKYLNIISIFALAITACTYYFLPEVQDIHGTCLFHLTLNMGLAHGALTYLIIKPEQLLSIMCKTVFYVICFIVLSAFSWSCILSYNMWKEIRNNQRIDEQRRIIRYKIFAYGIPALLIGVANIHIHGMLLFKDGRLQDNCIFHMIGSTVFYMLLPILLTILTNLFFFIDLQKRLCSFVSASRCKQTLKKKLIYRLTLNAKLFFIMGLPWILLLIAAIFSQKIISILSSLLICSEGLFIFLTFIVFRPRVRNSIVRKWFRGSTIIPDSWKTGQDLENTSESEYEMEPQA